MKEIRPECGLCEARFNHEAGWDFVNIEKMVGWMCPSCRARFKEALKGPGLPVPTALYGPDKAEDAFYVAWEIPLMILCIAAATGLLLFLRFIHGSH